MGSRSQVQATSWLALQLSDVDPNTLTFGSFWPKLRGVASVEKFPSFTSDVHNAIRLSTYGTTFHTAPDLVTLHVFSSSAVKVPFGPLYHVGIRRPVDLPDCPGSSQSPMHFQDGHQYNPRWSNVFLRISCTWLRFSLHIFLPCAPDWHSMHVQLYLSTLLKDCRSQKKPAARIHLYCHSHDS